MIITIGRKPFEGSSIDNVGKHGCGGINIEETRVGDADTRSPTSLTALGQNSGWQKMLKVSVVIAGSPNGRFPSNFFVSPSTAKLFPHTETHAGTYRNKSHCIGTSFTVTRPKGAVTSEGNSGSASRYFKMVEE